MAVHKVAHVTLTEPSVVKEIVLGAVAGSTAGGLWKMYHWNEQRKNKVMLIYSRKVRPPLLLKSEDAVVSANEFSSY